MDTDDLLTNENIAQVDFLETPTPSGVEDFSIEKQRTESGFGGTLKKEKDIEVQANSEQNIHHPISLEDAHNKIARFNSPEYFAGYDEIKGKPPPTISLFTTDDGRQRIELVGTKHAHQMPTQEERDAMIQGIDERFREYIQATATEPDKRLIMIEGASAKDVTTFSERVAQQDQILKNVLQQQNITSKQEAVEKFGEMGAMIFDATKEGILIMSPEPSPEEIVAKQKAAGIPEADIALKQAILDLDVYVHRGQLRDRKLFTPEEVFTGLRSACDKTGWQQDILEQTKAKLTGNAETDHIVMRTFIDHVLPILNARMQENQVGFNLVNPDYSWAFDPANYDISDRLNGPASKIEVFNKLNKITNEFRDDYILDMIHESVAEGKSPFIVYGDGHTVKLKPALAALYNQVKDTSIK